MPAEQIDLEASDHIELDRNIARAEIRLEQFALHVEGLANDQRQTLIAQAEYAQELNALINLRTCRGNQFGPTSAQRTQRYASSV